MNNTTNKNKYNKLNIIIFKKKCRFVLTKITQTTKQTSVENLSENHRHNHEPQKNIEAALRYLERKNVPISNVLGGGVKSTTYL